MKQLRFTTSQAGFFGESREPVELPNNLGKIVHFDEGSQKCRSIYIHGEAESLAGYDIPIFLDGDMNQVNLPVEEQNILMMLPNSTHKCKCTIQQDLGGPAYYITLITEPDR